MKKIYTSTVENGKVGMKKIRIVHATHIHTSGAPSLKSWIHPAMHAEIQPVLSYVAPY